MKRSIINAVLSVLLCLCAWAGTAHADPQPQPTPTPDNKPPTFLGSPWVFDAQITTITQQLYPFHSPYTGPNSFLSSHEAETSQTYTMFLGIRPLPQLEMYVNPEMARGGALSQAVGLAAYPNGEVIRNPGIGQPKLSQDPTVARLFARYTIPIGAGTEDVPKGENLIPGKRPTHRVVITAGRIGLNDIFDTNSYANSPRTQFMNWALINNAAYDYAADTRGYTRGIAVEYIQPEWALRAGTFQMPTAANGPNLANIFVAHGDQIELELHPHLMKQPAILRLLAYHNVADMGTYRQALELAAQTDTTPNIIATRKPGTVKYGFLLNAEQPLADDGASGLFARLGWDDGATESFAYSECDASASFGGQISGRHWDRPNDCIGLAYVIDGLSAAHRDYLAAGGLGFILGDGSLNYGTERVLETYYNFQVTKFFTLSLDFQHFDNPGYNKDRGPVNVISGRTHFEF